MEPNVLRSRLEELTLEDLQKEAQAYGLMQLEDRQQCMQAIISHLEKTGPIRDFSNQASNVPPDSNDISQIIRQNRELSEQLRQSNEMMQRMFVMMNVNQRNNDPRPSPTSSDQSTRSFVSSVPPAQAVKLLASQLPSYGGSEDENVILWLDKIESVARIHGVTHEVALLAATSKLTENAQRWFAHNTGTVNRSWINFKEAITRRFKRKVACVLRD